MKKDVGILWFIVSLTSCIQAKSTYDFLPVNRQIQQWVDKGYYPGASIRLIKDDK